MAYLPGSGHSAEGQLFFPAYVIILSFLLGFDLTGATEAEKPGVPAA